MKEAWLERVRRRLLFWGARSQVLGLLAALLIGSAIDLGFSGDFIGYAFGGILSVGGTFGLS